jgi:DNA polymerase III psi subunit
VILCDLDANMTARAPVHRDLSESVVAEVLGQCINTQLNNLITAEEEYTRLWTWALSEDASICHPAKNILSAAQDKLRSALGNDWRSESESARKIRERAQGELASDPVKYLTYQALKVDYYLTCCCDGDRSRLMLVLDNVDPLPPRIQYYTLDLASRFQTMSRCKLLISLRPLTYSSNLQGANRIIEIVEHIGPSVIDFIVHRIKKAVLSRNLSTLSVKITEDGRPDRIIGEPEAKRWVEEIVSAISRDPRQPSSRGDPAARFFIEGICGHSLRFALILAPKIFGSPVMSVAEVIDAGSPRHRVRDHDIIRSILDGWKGYYCAERGRVTDNIFDLGEIPASRSCTSKVRLLKKLHSSHNGLVSVGEIRQHLASFGYRDQLILDTVNSLINERKRLAWSDSVAKYETFEGYNNTNLKLSSGGAFYVEHAMFNLEYVQGVHVDVLVPREDTLEHDPRNFADRLRSLELFVRHVYQQDLSEVKHMMNNTQVDYVEVYGASLFSVSMIVALERQVKKVGNSMLNTTKVGKEKRQDIARTVERWNSLMLYVQQDSKSIIEKLASLNPQVLGETA